MAFPIVPVIGAAAGLLGSGIDAFFGSRNVQSANAANLKLAKYQYAKDLEMWERNNAYNTPQMQMQRLRAAGLNPNMVYGSGSVAGNTSGQIPKYQAPHINDAGIRAPFDLPSVIGAYQDFQVRQAQVDNLRAQEENTRARTISEAGRAALLAIQGKKGSVETSRLESLTPFDAQIRETQSRREAVKLDQDWEKLTLLRREELIKILQAQSMEKRMTLMDVEKEKKEAEKLYMTYRNQWLEMGVTTSDDPRIRILVRMMHEAGLTSYSEIGKKLMGVFGGIFD